MKEMTPIGEPRKVGSADVQYVGSSHHAHEGGHEVDVNGQTLLVLPDGRTTARRRSHVITQALDAECEDPQHLLYRVVGALLVAGATNLHVDGEPLIPDTTTPIVSLRLDLTRTGDEIDVHLSHLGDN